MRWITHAAAAALLIAAALALAMSPASATEVELGRVLYVPTPSNELAVSAFSALVAAALLVEGYPRYEEGLRIYRLDQQTPEAVKVFQSAFATGLTLADAVQMIAESGLKPINELFRSALVQYKLSGDLLGALERVSRRSGSRRLWTAVKIAIAAYGHGAGAEEALDALYRSLSQLKEYETRKRSQLGQYVAIIYVMVLIFSLVASIVAVGFIPQLQSIKASSSPFAQGIGAGEGVGLGVPAALSIIQMTSVAIAVFAGAITGRLIYGDPWAGFIHSSALIIIALAVYLASPLAANVFST